MKRCVLAILLVLLPAFAAQAASITVKGNTIRFKDPAGFVNLDGTRYAHIAADYRDAVDKDYRASHLYYSEEDIKAMDADKEGPGKFIAVMSFKDWVLQAYFKEYKQSLRDIYDPSKKLTNLAIEKSLGIFGETETDISVIVARKDSEEDEEYSQIYVATHMLRDRRLLIVAQYEEYTNAERYEPFKKEAVARLQSMNFPDPKTDALSTTVTAVASVSLLLVVAALGYGFYRFRPKKR